MQYSGSNTRVPTVLIFLTLKISNFYQIFILDIFTIVYIIFSPDLFLLNAKSEFFKTVSQMLNTVVKRLFAFYCAIYSLTYIFLSSSTYYPFFGNFSRFSAQFLLDQDIKKETLFRIRILLEKIWAKRNLKRALKGTMNCFINKEQTKKCKHEFPVHEHNIFVISGTFSCPELHQSMDGTSLLVTKGLTDFRAS